MTDAVCAPPRGCHRRGDPCLSSGDCPEDQACAHEHCTDVCSDVDPCPNGTWCDNGLCAGFCEILFDAAPSPPRPASIDPDNDPLTFVFQFNDGTEAVHSQNPKTFHSFEREGLYTVVVFVTDLYEEEGVAAQDVSIRAEYPDPPLFCDDLRPCVVGDECEDGVCFANGGTLE